jgi:hypothetical protein
MESFFGRRRASLAGGLLAVARPGQCTGYTLDRGDTACRGARTVTRRLVQPIAARVPVDARMRLEARSYSIVKTGWPRQCRY